ncbi:hypothetical protein IC614_05830 [Allosphingosinicella flava]|uniref:Terminase n=1 Tax=Allosphingosinicella flava TaxID=2771430 RepID=A0A7T2GM67_9SPHN|nr:hypothetical protein [Sphingosinicella flava]QPQ56088.1 hypothetical protein IC614_05830 [Sphingosinicella flava]
MADEVVKIAPGKGRLRQVRSVRRDGWTPKKRKIFLDHLAAVCNVAKAAEAAGMTDNSAFALRRRDPDFAEQWQAAMMAGYAQLETMLVERAMKGPLTLEGKRNDDEEGEAEDVPPPPDIQAMDTALALNLLRHQLGTIQGKMRAAGVKPRKASNEELTEAILAKLKILKARRARKADGQ